jgi:Fe-S cluster assembly protein SufD
MRLDRGSRSKGVVLAPLGDERTFDEYGDILKKRLFSFLDPFEDKFAMMNAAFWSGGIFIYVPEGVQVSLPIHLLRGVKMPGQAEVTRNLLVAGKGSSVNVFEDLVGTDVETLRNDVFEVVVEDGAKVEFQSIQDVGPKMKRIARYRARVERDASMRWFPAVFGSNWSVCRVESTLAGRGASNETYGAFLGYGSERMDFANNTFHLAPKTSNVIFARGIMLGRSSSVYRGNIEIHILAKHSTSQMKEETLLLSKDADAKAIPSLSIRTNEVQAKHAASVYQIDEAQTYYLMSRGLSKEESTRLMVEGFFAPIIGKLSLGKFRNRLEEKVVRGVHDGQI